MIYLFHKKKKNQALTILLLMFPLWGRLLWVGCSFRGHIQIVFVEVAWGKGWIQGYFIMEYFWITSPSCSTTTWNHWEKKIIQTILGDMLYHTQMIFSYISPPHVCESHGESMVKVIMRVWVGKTRLRLNPKDEIAVDTKANWIQNSTGSFHWALPSFSNCL